MKKIEVFNTKLNQSSNVSDKRLQSYISRVMTPVELTLKQMPSTKRICIIGAGRMNDFDVSVFLRFFDEIVLTDIDVSSVYEALDLKQLTSKERQKINVIRTEYTGFEVSHFFDAFKERMVNCHSFEKIDRVLGSLLDGVDRYQFLKDQDNDFDMVFVSPIYTQLIYHQVLRECSLLRETGYPEHLLKYIEEKMLDEMIGVIDRFNTNIKRVLHPDGRLVVVSDIFELDTLSAFYKRIENAIGSFDVVEEIYQGYKDKYGMGLGDYGLYNLEEEMDVVLSKWLIWPFKEQASFIVKLNILKK